LQGIHGRNREKEIAMEARSIKRQTKAEKKRTHKITNYDEEISERERATVKHKTLTKQEVSTFVHNGIHHREKQRHTHKKKKTDSRTHRNTLTT
jgi:hypothetical protein